MTKAQEIAKRIMEESVNNTEEGNWITYYDEIEERFGVQLIPQGPLEADIVSTLYRTYRNVILDMTYGYMSTDPECPCFDINLGLDYCPNYVWHDGDEGIFGSYDDFEYRTVLPLPAMEE